MTRPAPTDHSEFHARYVNLVPEDDLLTAMRGQTSATQAQVLAFAGRPDHRYAPGKWSVRQVLGHMADTERIFGYRALSVARGDPAPLPGVEQDDWMAASTFGSSSLEDLLAEFQAVRTGNLYLLGGLTPVAWERRGTASGHTVTVRALAYMLLGHERAHLDVLRERY
jgi:DinB superfamily